MRSALVTQRTSCAASSIYFNTSSSTARQHGDRTRSHPIASSPYPNGQRTPLLSVLKATAQGAAQRPTSRLEHLGIRLHRRETHGSLLRYCSEPTQNNTRNALNDRDTMDRRSDYLAILREAAPFSCWHSEKPWESHLKKKEKSNVLRGSGEEESHGIRPRFSK